MFEAMWQGLMPLFTPAVFLMLMLGILLGLLIGILPGVGVITGAALVLPFLFKVPPEVALSLLIAMSAVGFTGGAITAILINIPGDPPNVATCIDGYPMTKKGEAGRAIGAALTASTAAGIASIPLNMLLIPLVIPLVLFLKMPELFFVIVMGLSFVAVVGQGPPYKGLIAGGLGLLFAFVGVQPQTGISRFTGGTTYLFDGVDLISMTMGLFALPELIDMFIGGRSISKVEKVYGKFRDLLEGVKDVFRHWGVWLRSTLLGYAVGIIPGAGAMAAVFMAYAQAKQTSKHPEKFGTGVVEGVIAPQAAANAESGGALLTTLAFGIPGNLITAILLAAFFLVGIIPGPRMLQEHLPLSFTMLFGVVIANIIGGVICFVLAPYFIKVATIHPRWVVPIVLVMVFVGSYAIGEYMNNVLVAIFFGALGFFMERYGYSRAALLLGFILGSLFEEYFFHSLQLFGPFFFLRPASMVIIVLTALFLGQNKVGALLKRWRERPARA